VIYHPYDSDIIPIFYSDILTISLVNNIFQYIPLDITLLDNRTNIPNITIVYSDNIPIYQWEFQDPKMEVLYHISGHILW
jgi:hypothetical protein